MFKTKDKIEKVGVDFTIEIETIVTAGQIMVPQTLGENMYGCLFNGYPVKLSQSFIEYLATLEGTKVEVVDEVEIDEVDNTAEAPKKRGRKKKIND
jgi:hypothetical protein